MRCIQCISVLHSQFGDSMESSHMTICIVIPFQNFQLGIFQKIVFLGFKVQASP